MKVQKQELCGDIIYYATHDSGLRICVCPKKGYSSTYAIFGTAYGSIDTVFSCDGEEEIAVPEGIAHFLEHKLFESEQGDAFELFAKTGASANAFTSFDKTCYLFSCSDSVLQSLDILLDFVQNPYFTKETVQKEQGIIGQEIRMCEDNPGRRVLWNLLKAMYHRHPVNIEIAGTVESIAKIDDDLLYKCYNTFYQPSNMALCIAGNIDPEAVFEVVERKIKKKENRKIFKKMPDEPKEVVKQLVEEEFSVSIPMFYLGFKEEAGEKRKNAKELAATDVLLEMLASDSTALYREMTDEGIINQSFGYEYFEGAGYSAVLFGGESTDPQRVKERICEEMQRILKDGIDEELFECARRSVYGRNVASLGNVGSVARGLAEAVFSNLQYGQELEETAKLTTEDVYQRLREVFSTDRVTLSVLYPKDTNESEE